MDTHSPADAILSGELQAEIVLDGDGSIPNKSIYQYQHSLAGGGVIWKGKVKFVSKLRLQRINEYAAKKVAEKLAKDWRKFATPVLAVSITGRVLASTASVDSRPASASRIALAIFDTRKQILSATTQVQRPRGRFGVDAACSQQEGAVSDLRTSVVVSNVGSISLHDIMQSVIIEFLGGLEK